jgi:hypothetical protein
MDVTQHDQVARVVRAPIGDGDPMVNLDLLGRPADRAGVAVAGENLRSQLRGAGLVPGPV